MDGTDNLMNSMNMVSMSQQQSGQELKVSDTIYRPEDNIWTVTADDPSLHDKMINAVVHGERKAPVVKDESKFNLAYVDQSHEVQPMLTEGNHR